MRFNLCAWTCTENRHDEVVRMLLAIGGCCFVIHCTVLPFRFGPEGKCWRQFGLPASSGIWSLKYHGGVDFNFPNFLENGQEEIKPCSEFIQRSEPGCKLTSPGSNLSWQGNSDTANFFFFLAMIRRHRDKHHSLALTQGVGYIIVQDQYGVFIKYISSFNS